MPRLEVFSNITLALAIAVALVAYSDELRMTTTSWAPVAVILLLAVGGVWHCWCPACRGRCAECPHRSP